MYVSAEGRYLLRGNLIDLDQRQDLTEQTRSRARREALSKVDESEMIVFSPTSKKPRHTITVFTDVDCPYCRKLHSEIDEYTNAGIKVRYLMFPRMGKNSPSYYKAVNVWCAKDRNEALTEAKQGKELPKRTCKNPVQSQMELGQLIGVNGTPATVLENGEMVPGYRPAKEMVRLLAQSDSDD
jgi:thiol:disulfide interchange protein DsbC